MTGPLIFGGSNHLLCGPGRVLVLSGSGGQRVAASVPAAGLTGTCKRCFRGSALLPDGLLQYRRGGGLAKSTICWLSLSLSFPLFAIVYILFTANTGENRSPAQTVYTPRAFTPLSVNDDVSSLFLFFRAFVSRALQGSRSL